MNSMTGFAQERFDFEDFSLNISFKSLNHRFLDIFFKGTGMTTASEKFIREIIKEKIHRGKLEVVFNLFEKDAQRWDIQYNEVLLEDILKKLLPTAQKHHPHLPISFGALLRIPMIFHIDYNFDNLQEATKKRIAEAVEKVFSDFQKSRAREGEFILKELLNSITRIKKLLRQLEKESTKIEKEIFQSMKEKIERFIKDIDLDEKRIAQEAAISAEKMCVSEEISRIKSHNERLRNLITSNKISLKGREADFLTQEMHRETHTIASKTNSMQIHDIVLLIRREVEKIKQQVQNVE